MLRRGMWDAIAAFEEETGMECDPEDRQLAEELNSISVEIESGNVSTALMYVVTIYTETYRTVSL